MSLRILNHEVVSADEFIEANDAHANNIAHALVGVSALKLKIERLQMGIGATVVIFGITQIYLLLKVLNFI